MVTEYKNDVDGDINGDESKIIIKKLASEKLQLLKEKKTLYALLADKDEQILKISQNFKCKWESICEHLRYINQMCIEVQTSSDQLSNLKLANAKLLDSVSTPNMDSSISSYFTATDTADSTMSSSSESIVAKPNSDTLTKFPVYQSLNSLVNENIITQSNQIYNQLAVNELSHRSHSDYLQDKNNHSMTRSGIETDTSESLFRAPDNYVRRSKKLIRKPSNKPEKSAEKMDVKSNTYKPISEFTSTEIINWFTDFARLPKIIIEDIKLKNKINGKNLDQVTEQKFDKLFGTSDKLIKKKVFLALEAYKSDDDKKLIDNDDLASKDHFWVANVWLKKHLGLTHLSASFLSRCVDGRLLKFIASCNHSRMKDLIHLATSNYESSTGVSATPISNANKAICEPSKSDLRSLRFGLELLTKFDFNVRDLEKRRIACEDLDKDVLVWTNERFTKWFHHLNLKNYIRGMEYSGIHGAMMVLDSQFSVTTMSKLIQMPPEVAKKNNLEDKISVLLKPSRFNEGIKSRRSTSIFRRRSLSQPRFTKPININSTAPNLTSDASDSASINDSGTLTSIARHKEKCQTIDLSHSPSRNNNFIRTYRKPEHGQPKTSVTDIESEDLPTGRLFTKSPPPKVSALSFQLARKLQRQSQSDSDNDEDFEI